MNERADSLRHNDEDVGAESQLRAFLHERDVACPACGYNVRNLTSERCPECGRELHLNIKLRHPRMGAWVLLLMTLAACVGIVTLLYAALYANGRLPRDTGVQMVYLTSTIPMTFVLLRFRQQFLRIRPLVQWITAILIAVLSLAMTLSLIEAM